MARLSRFEVIKRMNLIIIDHLRKQPKILFSSFDLKRILSEKRKDWAIPKKTTFDEFVECVLLNKILMPVEIQLQSNSQIKFALAKSSVYEIALAINKGSYLSHSTAMYIHNLTNVEPESIYINTEQRKKAFNKEVRLIQDNIDRAFSRPMRETKQIARINNMDVYLLNGKNLNQLGVENIKLNGKKVIATGLERTLIDIAVRPNYSGGVNAVVKAYSAAKDKVNISKLVSMLKKTDYIYPYHQTIGFYMDRSGYKETDLRLLEEFNIQYNFYLTYQIVEKQFSDKWKIFYPKNLDI